MRVQKVITLSLILAASVLLPAAAFAAGGHGAGHTPSFMDLKWFWVNFLVYVIGLTLILRNPVRKGWLARRTAIADAVGAAKRDADAARQELLEAQRKMQGLDADIARLSADIERETQREASEILNQSKARAERIAQQSKETAEGERKATEALIRRELVNVAIERARERLQKEMTAQTDKPLRDTALGAVQQLIQ